LWRIFKQHLIAEYKQMFCKGGGSTFDQEGCSTAYSSIEADGNNSVVESIVQYTERATIAKSKESAIEECLLALELGANPQPPQMAFYAPSNPSTQVNMLISPHIRQQEEQT
jgi:hypothetical protein